MKLPKRLNLIWLGMLIMACLAVASCGKKVSPPETKQSRLDWNLKTSIAAYQDSGNTNAKWDEPTTRALEEFARSRAHLVNPGENWVEIIGTNCAAAIQAGCDDPMIRYLYIRNYMSQTNSPRAFADAFCIAANDMQQSPYPPIRKFYSALRALDQIYYTYPTNADRSVTIKLGNDVLNNLMEVLADKTTPPEEAFEACDQALVDWSAERNGYEACYKKMETPLFANWPDASGSWLLKGKVYLQMAWLARGGGYANNVTPEGWKLFGEYLAVADSALEKAWKLNPNDERIPMQMIRIAEGRQKNRDNMELWFNRAMIIDPNCYQACQFKLHYLYPQWYGSRSDMVAFGRECATSANWGGNVPLILCDAHREYWLYLDDSVEKSNYWKLPDVWPDIKVSFDKFFKLNPDAIGYYHNYAWYAYRAEQWDALNEIIPQLGPVNYSYFGGKDEFEKMVRFAKEHAKPK